MKQLFCFSFWFISFLLLRNTYSLAQGNSIYNTAVFSFCYNNNNFYISSQGYVKSFDTNAVMSYSKGWGGPYVERFYEAYIVSEGGQKFILWLGSSESFITFPVPKPVSYIIKTDLQGDTIWSHVYDQGYASGFCVDNDSNYLVTLVTSYGHIIKIDRNTGDTLWTRKNIYQPNGIYLPVINNYIEKTDSSFSVTGTTIPLLPGPVSYPAFMLLKTDTSGNTMWIKTYGDSTDNNCLHSALCSDGGFALIGCSAPITNNDTLWYHDILVVRTTVNGDTLWCRRYDNDSLVDKGYCILQTPDQGFVMLGSTESFITVNGQVVFRHGKSILIRADSLGNILWSKTYDFNPNLNGSVAPRCLKLTDQNGFMWAADVLYVTDSLGNNCLAQPTIAVATNPEIIPRTISTIPNQGLTYHFRPNTQQYSGGTNVSLHCGPVAVDEIEKENSEIIIHPNPANNIVTISVGEETDVFICNALGNEVLKAKSKNGLLQTDVSKFVAGVYFVSVKSNLNFKTKKLVVY